MKTKMRIAAFLMAAAMMATAFAGCKSKPGNESSIAMGNNPSASDQDVSDTESDGEDLPGDDVDTESTDSAVSDVTSETSSTASSSTSSMKTSTSSVTTADKWGVASADKSKDPLEQGYNLKGFTFKLIGTVNPYDTSKSSTKEDKAKKEMIEMIEKKLNCKIKFISSPYSKTYSTYQTKIRSGQDVGNAIFVNIFEIGSFISAGMLKDIKKDLPKIDTTAPYWNQNIASGTTIKGKQYALGIGTDLYASQVVFFNKTIAQEIGAGDLYALAKAKNFTIDTFIDLAKKTYKDTDGVPGKTENDRFGVAQTHWNTALSLFCGSGIHMLTEENGKVVFNFKPVKNGKVNQAAIDYMNKLKTVCFPGENSVKTDPLNKFIDGKALFYTGMLTEAGKMGKMKQDFGVLPTPNAGKGKDYYNMVDWNDSAYIIPRTNKKLEETSIVLEALAYHQYYDVQALALEDYGTRNFRDKESADMLNFMKDSGFHDLGFFAGVADENISNIINKIIVPSCEDKLGGGGYDPAKAIPMYEDKIRAAVDEFYNK